jgi:succinate-semialdehyde dehydrogenase/glutarate-semialdehyde dehydrogenase
MTIIDTVTTGVGLDPALISRLTSKVRSTTDDFVEVISPITGTRLAEVPESSIEDVISTFAVAKLAQRSWAATPLRERTATLMRLHDLLLKTRDEILDVIQWETGKARRDALEELLDVCVNARHYARDAKRLLQPKRRRGALPILVGAEERRIPKGAVGIIAPWNYPLSMAASDAIPALIAGNSVVLKPDDKTLLTALWIVDLMHQAGVPEDVFQVLVGDGLKLGKDFVAECDYLMFTGSTRVGGILASQCGEQLKGCSMELGGKNAMIVCDDIDIDKAVTIAVRGCFANAGQLCVSMERMYIQRSVWDRFVPALVERVRSLNIQVGLGWGAEIGSLISEDHLRAVEQQIAEAVSKGATLLAGGRARPDIGPYAFEPALLADVTPEMTLCREETFGPVVSLYPFDTDDDAVYLANDTRYGLNSSVLCKDTNRGREIARQLHSGTVNVNEGYAAAWGTMEAPMGGMGDSGVGRRHGDDGLLKYTEAQTIAVQRALGYGPQFGMNDERWGELLVSAVGFMKKIGFK